MPPKRPPPKPEPSRLRRYVLLELPAWLLVGVSVAYAIVAGGVGFAGFFEATLLLSAVAWLAGGRMADFTWGGLLIGWAVGTMALLNSLVWAISGIAVGGLLLPVTAFLVVVLVLLEMSATTRQRLVAGGGAALSVAVQLIALAVLAHT